MKALRSVALSRGGLSLAALAVAPVTVARPADAHTGASGFILLLPTHLYVAGGAIVVAASFLLVAVMPPAWLVRAGETRWPLGRLAAPRRLAPALSLVSLVAALALIAAGLVGSRDPLANPLPLFVWTVWWIGLTSLHALAGDLWAHVNPWRGLYRVVTSARRLRAWRERPPLPYPAWLGHWPALLGLALFAWLELVDPAPTDPGRLAVLVTAYLGGTFVALLLFGETWLERGETFSVFFRMVAWLSPVGPAVRGGGSERVAAFDLAPPGLRLLTLTPLDGSGVAFVLLALATVSFDGLSRTFTWLASVGVNPLEYPGRSALVVANSLGLAGAFAALALAYTGVVLLGRALQGGAPASRRDLGRAVLSIVPIAFGYHVAHYLPVVLLDVQYAVRALSDPFGRGWNLLGTADLHVIVSFAGDPVKIYAVWSVQVAVIVVAHVVAVVVAHALARSEAPSPRRAVLGQVPITLLMIAYTVLGLWLLSTPTVS